MERKMEHLIFLMIRRKTSKIIRAITVKDILDELIAYKLA